MIKVVQHLQHGCLAKQPQQLPLDSLDWPCSQFHGLMQRGSWWPLHTLEKHQSMGQKPVHISAHARNWVRGVHHTNTGHRWAPLRNQLAASKITWRAETWRPVRECSKASLGRNAWPMWDQGKPRTPRLIQKVSILLEKIEQSDQKGADCGSSGHLSIERHWRNYRCIQIQCWEIIGTLLKKQFTLGWCLNCAGIAPGHDTLHLPAILTMRYLHPVSSSLNWMLPLTALSRLHQFQTATAKTSLPSGNLWPHTRKRTDTSLPHVVSQPEHSRIMADGIGDGKKHLQMEHGSLINMNRL